MAKEYRFFGIKEANADIKASSDAINALLTTANITTINVNGKPMPATSDDVPNALKIAAFAATVKEGAGDADLSTALANNSILAQQAKDLESRAVTAETNAGTLLREKTEMEGQLATERASVARLAAENAEVLNLRSAANGEASRLTGQLNALNSELSRRCLAIGCLSDLRDEKNELLPSTASAAQRQSAADRIPAADKINAVFGAVNSTLTKLGVDVSRLPSGGGNLNLTNPATGILAQYNLAKAQGAEVGVAFYRKNAEAIDAAIRAQQRK